MRFISLLCLGVASFVLFLQGAWAATTITSSSLSSIVIMPNNRPTVVDLFTDQQFLATGYAEDGQPLTGLTFQWSVGGEIGRINNQGIFTASKGGIGTITARNGSITATVGVVVKGAPPITEPAKTSVKKSVLPKTTTVVQEINTTQTTPEPQNSQGAVLGASTDDDPSLAAATTIEPPNNTNAPVTCTTIRGWVWALIFFGYILISFLYYLSLGESRTGWWWLWPLLLTGLIIALFSAIRCPTHQLWVPWTSGILAILLGLFYIQFLRPREFERPTL